MHESLEGVKMKEKYKRTLLKHLNISYEYYSPVKKKHKKNVAHEQCSIRALMKISGESDKKVYERLNKAAHHKDHYSFGNDVDIIMALAKKQYDMEPVKIGKKLSPCVATFCASDPKGTYLVFIQNHVFPYIDGCIYDANYYDDEYTADDMEFMLTQTVQFAMIKR